MTLFGEERSESPRLPSPWRAVSSTTPSKSASPSPLNLSIPGTPTNAADTTSDVDPNATFLELENDFEALTFGDDDDDFRIEPLQVNDLDETQVESLSPEVDKKGHIEYKLKLLSPNPLRLAKLVTQLKWRLVEGGGVALYELGILDDGTLVGLSYDEMKESIETLGKMLRCLGGGEVRVGRVVRLGGRLKGRRSDSVSGGDDVEVPASPLFDSLVVEASEDAEVIPAPFIPTRELPSLNLDGSNTRPPPSRLQPIRTPEERAIIRRQKRDNRRERQPRDKESAPDAPVVPRPPRERREWIPRDPSKPKPIPPRHPPKERPPKLTKKAKYILSQSAPARSDVFGSRPIGREDGEVRYVVEAVVTKKKAPRRCSEGDGSGESEDIEGQVEPQESDEEEGWRYLEFDNFHLTANAVAVGRKGSV